MARQLPIAELIGDRLQELNIRRGEVAGRAGRKNGAKILRQLDALVRGDIGSGRGLVELLPQILDLPAAVIQTAIDDTRRLLEAEAEAAWRADFLPHSIILCELERPTQISLAAIIGVDRLLRIDFDQEADESSYVGRTLEGIDARLKRWESSKREIPFFGKPIGFIINFSPNMATRYDLTGKAVEELMAARRLGSARLSFV
jgi:hypothetical protein